MAITAIPCSGGSNPPAVIVPERRQCQLAATAWDGNGQEVDFAAFRWSIGNAAIATVDLAGEVTGVAVGRTTVRVEILGDPTIFDDVQVSVIQGSPTGARDGR